MNFAWLKRYMPRGLYGRAALILLVPIVAIQLVVSTAFIQRYFADVTEQMTRNLTIDLGALLKRVEAAETIEAANRDIRKIAEELQLSFTLPAEGEVTPVRVFYDLSGIAVANTLRAELPNVGAIDLGEDQKVVRFEIETRFGPAIMSFSRHRVSASNPHQLLVIMLLAGVLLSLIAYLFLRNQLRPIKKLADTAEAFGKGRSEVYHPRGATEVRAAGNAFLDMRNRIERQLEQRTLMLSGVSHDLRTPLTRLRLGLSMVENEAEAKAMEADVDEMESLITAFLDFARGAALEEPEATDPAVIARMAVEKAERAGKDAKLLEVAEGLSVKLRPVALQRALDNLVGNAVRYGNRAEVSLTAGERALVFRVEDDGPGIAEEQREEALQPFARLEPGRNQNKGSGVGLGLSIAMDIARNHGGTLRLGKSESLGGLKAELVLAL